MTADAAASRAGLSTAAPERGTTLITSVSDFDVSGEHSQAQSAGPGPLATSSGPLLCEFWTSSTHKTQALLPPGPPRFRLLRPCPAGTGRGGRADRVAVIRCPPVGPAVQDRP